MIPQGISGRFVDPSAVEVDWMKRRLSEIDILADTVDRAEETFGFIIPPPPGRSHFSLQRGNENHFRP